MSQYEHQQCFRSSVFFKIKPMPLLYVLTSIYAECAVKCLARCSEPLTFPDISCGMRARVRAIIPLVSFSDYYAGTWSRYQSVTDIRERGSDSLFRDSQGDFDFAVLRH